MTVRQTEPIIDETVPDLTVYFAGVNSACYLDHIPCLWALLPRKNAYSDRAAIGSAFDLAAAELVGIEDVCGWA